MRVTSEQLTILQEELSADLAKILMEEWHYSMEKALDVLYNSDTFALIQDTGTGLYYQSPGYVYSFLEEELMSGRVGV